MSYIYVITNTINQRKYVGKTEKTVEERFRQHIKDSQKNRINLVLYIELF